MKQAYNETIAFSASDNQFIKMWSIGNNANGNPIVEHQKTFNGHTRSVNHVLINKYQNPINEIVTCGFDSTIEARNIATGKNKTTIQCDKANYMTWWKQDQFLIIGTGRGTGTGDIHILQWNKVADNCERGKIIRTLKGHTGTVFELLVDEESDQLLSCSGDKTIRLWNLNTGQQMKQFNGHTSDVNGLYKLNKNLFVSAGDDKRIKFWNMASGECIHTIDKAHSNYILSVLYSASEQVLILSGWDKTVKVWDLKFDNVKNTIEQCTLKFTIDNPFNIGCYSSAFLDGENDGTRVIVGDIDGNMFIVDVKSGTCISQVENAHSDAVTFCAVLHKQENGSMNKKLQKMQQDKKFTNVVIQHK